MTRSNAREIAVHLIYACECSDESAEQTLDQRLDADYYTALAQENEVYAERPSGKQESYIRAVVLGVESKREQLEELITKYAIGWSFSRISRLARAVLELAIYEALYVDDVPVNAAIHEAVVLTKKYEEDETVSFVNGVLGSFSRAMAAETGETSDEAGETAGEAGETAGEAGETAADALQADEASEPDGAEQ